METIKAALYCRLSEEDQDKVSPDQDSESIQNQRSLLTRYAKQQKWEIAGVYIDDNYAGADRNRPAFRRLLSDAEQGKFQVVLCKTQSRFTREMELVEKYLHDLFPIWGIRFIGVVDHTDTASAGNKKARQINGLVNEWYLEDLSDNIKSVLTDKRKRGQHIGSFAPYGYRKDPEEKGHLLPDEEAAAVVRDVFTWYCQGMGKTAIARLLNERGIPNPTEYKRRQGLRYQQSHSRTQTIWRYSSIDGVLRNPVYIGHMVQGKQESVSYKHRGSRPRPPSLWYIVENTHIPLIRQSLWEQAQRQLQQRSKPFSSGMRGPFTGLLFCGVCGGALHVSKSHGRRYYQCATHRLSPSDCPGVFCSGLKLEETVLAQIQSLLKQTLDLQALREGIQHASARESGKMILLQREQALRKRQTEHSLALKLAYQDRASGRLTEALFSALLDELLQGKRQLEREIQTLQNDLAGLPGEPFSQQQWQTYQFPQTLEPEMTEALVEKIVVFPRQPSTHCIPLEIYWKV